MNASRFEWFVESLKKIEKMNAFSGVKISRSELSKQPRFFICRSVMTESADRFDKSHESDADAKAPFDPCLIETVIPRKEDGVLVRLFICGLRIDDGVMRIAHAVAVTENMDMITVMSNMEFALNTVNGTNGATINKRCTKASTSPYVPWGAAFTVTIATAIVALYAINSPHAVLSHCAADAKKNQMLRLRGKTPLSPHHVVTLRPEAVDRAGVASSAPSILHAPPRQHDRRGHYRSLKSGKVVWVRSCVVGRADRGVVSKEYRVVN